MFDFFGKKEGEEGGAPNAPAPGVDQSTLPGGGVGAAEDADGKPKRKPVIDYKPWTGPGACFSKGKIDPATGRIPGHIDPDTWDPGDDMFIDFPGNNSTYEETFQMLESARGIFQAILDGEELKCAGPHPEIDKQKWQQCRKPFVAAWVTGTEEDAIKAVESVNKTVTTYCDYEEDQYHCSHCVTVICPQDDQMDACKKASKGKKYTGMYIGSQGVAEEGSDAMTAEKLKEEKWKWCILGHGPAGEENLPQKVAECQKNEVNCVICIKKSDVLETLVPKIKDWSKITIATDLPKTRKLPPNVIEDAHAAVRKFIEEKAGKAVADRVRIIYGGMLSEEIMKEYITIHGVDGFFVCEPPQTELTGNYSLCAAWKDIRTFDNSEFKFHWPHAERYYFDREKIKANIKLVT